MSIPDVRRLEQMPDEPEHEAPPDDDTAAAEEGARPRPWQPVNLGPVLDGTYQPPQPTVGRRKDGAGMLYPGRAHTVVSETEGGKTWLALSWAVDEMNAGHHVVYIDFEDDEGGVVGRLLLLAAHPDVIRERFHYLRPDMALGSGVNRDDLDRVLSAYEPTLGVIDSVTEAMTVHGLNPLDNADAATFGRLLPRRITEAGAACASLDHVTKATEGRGRYALGAVHKLNALNGAAYLLENRTAFGVGLTGRSTVRIAKDRPGQLRRNALPSTGGSYWFGDLVLTSHHADLAEVSVEPPREHSDDFRPTILMGRISDALTEHGPLAQRRLDIAVTGKAANIRAALDCLILDGYVSEKTPHELLKPYPPGVDSK